MTACVLQDIGKQIDPACDLAREIVAYTFQEIPSPVIDRLFDAGIETAHEYNALDHAATF